MKASVYRLTMEDLTSVGGPMGSERVTTIGVRIFETQEAAKAAAEKKLGRRIHWNVQNGRRVYADCGHIGFEIAAVDIES